MCVYIYDDNFIKVKKIPMKTMRFAAVKLYKYIKKLYHIEKQLNRYIMIHFIQSKCYNPLSFGCSVRLAYKCFV